MQSAASVSVIVPGGDLGRRLLEIVGSLDAQTLPYARYQVIFVDPGSTDRTSARLAELATGRPNLTVVEDVAGGDPLQAGLRVSTGDYVLQLGEGDRLQHFALERLLDRATAENADIVLARSAGTGPIGHLPDLDLADWKAAANEAAVGMLAPCMLIRRDLLSATLGGEAVADGIGWRAIRLSLLSAAIRDGRTIARYTATPVATGPGPSFGETPQAAWSDAAAAGLSIDDRPEVAAWFVAAHLFAIMRRSSTALDPAFVRQVIDAARTYFSDPEIQQLPPAQRPVLNALLGGDVSTARTAARTWGRIAPTCSSTQTRWVDGRLIITVQGQLDLPKGGAADDLVDSSFQLALRSVGGPVEYRLDTETTLNRGDDSLAFTLSAAVDPMSTAAGAALDRGRWQFLIRVYDLGTDSPVREAIPHTHTQGAIVDGEPIALYEHNKQLRLDVGSRSSAFLGRYKPADANITESAAGSLLTIRLPDVAVRGDADISGHLLLDSFPLPGALRVNDGAARIECFVSGLAGVSRLSARFGPAAMQDLGLQLRICGSGDMAIEQPTPKPARKAAKKPAVSPSKAVRSSPASEQHPGTGGQSRAVTKPGGRARAGDTGRRRKRSDHQAGRKSTGRTSTLTSRLPTAVQPVARRAAGIPVIRRTYRSLKKLVG